MSALLLSLPCLLFFSATASAQVTPDDIDAIVRRAMDTFHVAGAAVAVVKDGQIVLERGYGLRTVEGNTPVDAHTNFGIASNSKAFTTTALALLVEDGKLSWDDHVVAIIPEFRMYDPYVTEHFTITDLLTHRSGLGLGAGDLTFFPDGADYTMDDIVRIFQYFEPESEFRTRFDYDNLLYLVAGEVIRRVSGMSWEDFVEERIFGPLGMDGSFTSLTFTDESTNKAYPHLNEGDSLYRIEPERWDPVRKPGSAGGIYANVHDLTAWMLLHLNQGKYGPDPEDELFSATTQRDLWKIYTTTDANRNPRYNSHFSGYGLGWFLEDLAGNMVVSHTGGLFGMLSKTVLVPDLDLGIIVLTNTSNDGAGLFGAVSSTVMDRYMELEPFDWIALYDDRFRRANDDAREEVDGVWATVAAANDHAIDPENYTGTYEDPWFGSVDISNRDGTLFFQSVRSPKIAGPLHYYGESTFVAKWESESLVDADAFVIFTLDGQGKGQSIHMKGISPAIDFSYDFQDLKLRRTH